MMSFNFLNSLILNIFMMAPLAASASYVCNCYSDSRAYGYGLIYQGQVEAPTMNTGSTYCNNHYSGARVATCYEKASSSQSSSYYSSSSSESSQDSKTVSDCIKAPAGIADVCIQAFEPEAHPNPDQVDLLRRSCIEVAISVAVVKKCLKKFPLHKTSDGQGPSDRYSCISDLSVNSKRVVYRCPL